MSNLIDQDKAVESVENIVCSMSVCMSLEECKGMKRMQKRVIEVLTDLPSAQPERILYANMSDAEFEAWLYEHGICNPNIHESIPCDVVPLLIDNAISELPSAPPDKEALDDAYAHGYTAAESEFRKRMDGQPESAKEYCAECNHIEMCRWYPHEGCEFRSLPSAQPEQQWIPCSERMPEDLEEVNVTWVNHGPEPYYDFTKDKPATASAVYYKGKWYWYSSVCTDLLAEYGENEVDKMDDAIEVLAWMPLPECYTGE